MNEYSLTDPSLQAGILRLNHLNFGLWNLFQISNFKFRISGLLISDSFYRHQVLAEIHPFRGLFLGLFFMSMGMSLNLDLLIEKPLPSLGIAALLILIKALVLFPIASWFGLKGRHGVAISLVLAQSGEFALILFSMAFKSDILSEELFQQL